MTCYPEIYEVTKDEYHNFKSVSEGWGGAGWTKYRVHFSMVSKISSEKSDCVRMCVDTKSRAQ